MTKKKLDAELAEQLNQAESSALAVHEAEAVPLTVVTREPSDEEFVAELAALKVIAERYARRASEWHHASLSLENAIWWIERARERALGKTA